MADISQIQVVNEVFDIKDAPARANIAEILKYKSMTKEQMLTVVDDDMPDVCSTWCIDDQSFYVYNKTNEPNEETGKFELYQNLTIEELSNTPYVFVKPTSILLTGIVPEWMNQSYSLDNICTETSTGKTPIITFTNEYEETTFEPDEVLRYGDTFDIYSGKYTETNKYISFTSASYVYSFGELNSNNIRKITLRAPSSSSAKISDVEGALMFCTHLPYLTDYVDDASVTQEGYRLRYSSYTYVDIYISGDREYSASKDLFGTQLETWKTNSTPFRIAYKRYSDSTSTVINYSIPPQIYLNPNYTISTNYPDEITVDVSISEMVTLNDVMYDIQDSLKSLKNAITGINTNKTNIRGGLFCDGHVSGTFTVGRFIGGITSDIGYNLSTNIFGAIIQGVDIDSTRFADSMRTLLLSTIPSILSQQPNYGINIYDIINNRTDMYYCNITNITVPIYLEGSDPLTHKPCIFNTILNIEKIPYMGPCPIQNSNSEIQDEIVHEFRTTWTDCDGDLNILYFTITSTYTAVNDWTGSRQFVYATDGVVQKVPKYQSEKSNASTDTVPTIEYTCDNPEYYEYLFGAEDISILDVILTEYRNVGTLLDDLKTATGMSTFVEIIQNVKKFGIDIILSTEIENGEMDSEGNMLFDTETHRISLLFNRDDMYSWVSTNPNAPSSSLVGKYLALTSATIPSKLANVVMTLGCYSDGSTSLENYEEIIENIEVRTLIN